MQRARRVRHASCGGCRFAWLVLVAFDGSCEVDEVGRVWCSLLGLGRLRQPAYVPGRPRACRALGNAGLAAQILSLVPEVGEELGGSAEAIQAVYSAFAHNLTACA